MKKVTITCDTEQAQIRYTLNGTDPTESSTLYSGPFYLEDLSEDVVIKARAYRSGYQSSNVVIQEVILETLQSPTLQLQGEEGSTTRSVYISNYSSYPDSAQIYYSFVNSLPFNDGTNIITGSALKQSSGLLATLTVDQESVWVAVRCTEYKDSSVSFISGSFPTLTAPDLSLTRSGSTVLGSISNTIADATYRFRINSQPSSATDGTLISGTTFSFVNSSALSVGVRGFKDGYHPSPAATASVGNYTNPTPTAPSLSYVNSNGTLLVLNWNSSYRYYLSSDMSKWSTMTENPFPVINNSVDSKLIYCRAYYNGYYSVSSFIYVPGIYDILPALPIEVSFEAPIGWGSRVPLNDVDFTIDYSPTTTSTGFQSYQYLVSAFVQMTYINTIYVPLSLYLPLGVSGSLTGKFKGDLEITKNTAEFILFLGVTSIRGSYSHTVFIMDTNTTVPPKRNLYDMMTFQEIN